MILLNLLRESHLKREVIVNRRLFLLENITPILVGT